MLKSTFFRKSIFLAGFPGLINRALHQNIQGLSGTEYLNLMLPHLISLLFIVTAVAAFFYLLVGGIRFITSGGDKAQTEAARAQITNAMIGLAIAFTIYALITLIGQFFGVNLIYLDINSLIIQ